MTLYKTKQGGLFSLLACLFIILIYILPFNGIIRDLFSGYNNHSPMIYIPIIAPVVYLIFMTLHVMFSCIIIDEKFIEERSGFGSSKVIHWTELISIIERNTESKSLDVNSENKTIEIKASTEREYDKIKDLIINASNSVVIEINKSSNGDISRVVMKPNKK